MEILENKFFSYNFFNDLIKHTLNSAQLFDLVLQCRIVQQKTLWKQSPYVRMR